MEEKKAFSAFPGWLESHCIDPEKLNEVSSFTELNKGGIEQNVPLSKTISPFKIWTALFKQRRYNKQTHLAFKNVTFLDTALRTDNAGDFIISQACKREIERATRAAPLTSTISSPSANPAPSSGSPRKLTYASVGTHQYSPKLEDLASSLKIVTGTNLVYTHMEDEVQWSFPKNLFAFNNTCFMGVCMNDIRVDESFSAYSKKLLRFLFDTRFTHSVRDSFTLQKLNSIGITNVVNTSCPSLWPLTPEKQSLVPTRKGKAVITTVTDYNPDTTRDKEMLEVLKKNYEYVVIWLQGKLDWDLLLKNIVEKNNFYFLPPSLDTFCEAFSFADVEYIGTRLHAGIKALNEEARSLIVSIDGRARNIARTTNLPIIERSDENFAALLQRRIEEDRAPGITLPENEIQLFLEQFAIL